MAIQKIENTGLTTKTVTQTLLLIGPLGRIPSAATIFLTNSHAANTIQYRHDESNDPEGADGTWVQVRTWTDIAPYAASPANGKKIAIIGLPLWIRIQVKTKTGSSHGTANGWFKGTGL